MAKYGYIRVSAKDQNIDRQMDALLGEGIAKSCIYCDKQSGKNFDRPEYKRLIKKLKKGDVLVIKSIDRLGRNYDEILKHWRILTQEMLVDIEVLDFPLLNTDARTDGLTGVFISDLVLQILAYVAETERTFIRKRQAEGIASARIRGIKFGRKRMPMSDHFDECVLKWCNGEMTMKQAAEELNISTSTFCRRCHEALNESKRYPSDSGSYFKG
ncbi:MAG: recombinase family protein [Lachnospiraceae bacterium]|nr:recombinase family protein [Lachnospiraceae bacterium]